MSPTEMKSRTKKFALRIIRLSQSLPRDSVSSILGRQLIRSGTSVGANYRASCRAKSRPDFISKMNIVEEECDEAMYWMELLVEAGIIRETKVTALMKEADEILAIVVSSITTARTNIRRNPQSAIRNLQ